jgi:orotate phosphoribosyltransferase
VPAAVLLALDRQERSPQGDLSAVQEVRERLGVPVVAVVTLTDLMQHIKLQGRDLDLARMQAYRDRYGLPD